MLTLLRFCFSVLCVCIYIISIIVITIYYTIDCCLLCQSWWHFSPLIRSCYVQSWALVCCCSANHKLFSICLPFIIFLQHKGYCNLLRATMCVLSAMLTLLRFCFFCVMCLYWFSGLVFMSWVVFTTKLLDTNNFPSVFSVLLCSYSDAAQA